MTSQYVKTRIIHKDHKETVVGDLIKITEKTWHKIVICTKVKKEAHKNPQWPEAITRLPCDQSTDGASHIQCYQAFTFLPKLRNNTEPITKSSSGVFPK